MAQHVSLSRNLSAGWFVAPLRGEEKHVIRMLVVGLSSDADEGLLEYLGSEGYRVDVVDAPAELDENACKTSHLVFLDADAPGVDATGLCRRLRGRNEQVPLIVLSKKGSEVDKARALLAGADDYLVRPFGYLELSARVKAVLRRSGGPSTRVYQFGSVTIDFDRLLATKRGKTLELSPREFELLEYLVTHEGEVVTRTQLLEAIWGISGQDMTRPIDMHIVKLRRKLEDRGKPRHILTVRSVGYRFVRGASREA